MKAQATRTYAPFLIMVIAARTSYVMKVFVISWIRNTQDAIHRSVLHATFAVFGVVLFPINAGADWLEYQLTFSVTEGSVCSESQVEGELACEDVAGRQYHGSFSVDEGLLATDGLKQGTVGYFLIAMEDNIWGFNLPEDNSFFGFRGPALEDPSPLFDVQNGEIVDLQGGVYGGSDEPFVDFSASYAPNTFGAVGQVIHEGEPFRIVYPFARGTLEVTPKPFAAIDDGPIGVTAGVAKVIPVGSNDTGFTNPVTVTVTTPPTRGTITAISSPGPSPGMTITYTPNSGVVGADSFVYQMTDSTSSSDSATVRLNSLFSRADGLAYFDSATDLTWVSDANLAKTSGFDADGLMNLVSTQAWIASLNAANYLGVNDWRLPTTAQPDITCALNGLGCTGSEMGRLFQVTGIRGVTSPAPFSNVQSSWANFYWSGTAANSSTHFIYSFVDGRQAANYDSGLSYAWAVRSGDIALASDVDGDGVRDHNDNCTLVANPTQLDANHDGYGNRCDADLNNSGQVTAADYAILRSVILFIASESPIAAAADLNGSGQVTATDYAILRSRIGTTPGPSGLACAGSIPCLSP